MPARGTIAGLAATAGFAVLVLDPFVAAALVGCLVLGTTGWGPAPASRAALLAAGTALAGSAVATVTEAPLTDPWLATFAADRPLAGTLGAIAGVLTMAALALELASGGSAPAPMSTATEAEGAADHALRSTRAGRGGWPSQLRDPAGLVLATLVALVFRARWGPGEIDGAIVLVRNNLEAGVGYGRGVPTGEAVAPMVPGLLLVSGLGPAMVAAAALGVAAISGALLGGLRRGARLALPIGMVAVLLPSTWSQPLPVLVALAAVGAAAAALELPAAPSPARAMGAGSLVAVGLLADPTAALAAVVLVAALVCCSASGLPTVAALLAPVLTVAGLEAAGVARLGTAWSSWWAAGGELASVAWPGWLVDVLAAVVAATLLSRPRRMAPVVVALAGGLALAHLGRAGGSLWAWSGVLVVAIPTWSVTAVRMGATDGRWGAPLSRLHSVRWRLRQWRP